MKHVIRGDRIRRLRRAADITQKDLAKQVEVEQAFLSAIEKGHKQCSVSTLVAIAKALGTSTDYLLGVEDDEPATAAREG
jgi:transcriptional regulator with XRE-family HTH domain